MLGLPARRLIADVLDFSYLKSWLYGTVSRYHYALSVELETLPTDGGQNRKNNRNDGHSRKLSHVNGIWHDRPQCRNGKWKPRGALWGSYDGDLRDN